MLTISYIFKIDMSVTNEKIFDLWLNSLKRHTTQS